MRTGAEVSKYVIGRGGVERFSLCQRGEAVLVFVEEEGVREQGVPTEDLGRMAWEVLGKIWYRPRLLWRFLRNQPPPDDFSET
jgi:hypothetical protein